MVYVVILFVFDGLEDCNGKWVWDEMWLWLLVLDGYFGELFDSFVIVGFVNIDFFDGEGDGGFMCDFFNDL